MAWVLEHLAAEAALEQFTGYVLDFVRPELAAMTAGRPAAEAAQIEAGAERFGSLSETARSSFSATIWRARGTA